ncbi:MAG: cupredoxin domain-containing protein [Nanoarchaeota archaeon]
MKYQSVLFALFISVFLVSGCSTLDNASDKIAAPGTLDDVNGSCTESGCTMGDDSDTESMKEFTIHENNFKFDVKEIKVKLGDKVKITSINDQGFHNLAVPDFNVRTEMGSSPNEMMIEFTADKTGEFPYFCEVGGHKNAGMEGKLIVES